MGKNGDGLLQIYSGKPFEKFVNCCSRFEVLEERSNGHASAPKNPGTTELAFAAFYLRTISPVEHAQHDMLHFWHGQ